MANISYSKIYLKERTEAETNLSTALEKLWQSQELNKDPHFFGRAVGYAIEDCVNNAIKQIERDRGNASEEECGKFIEGFFSALSATLSATKRLHKLRNGE